MIKPEKIGRLGQLYMGDCLEIMNGLDDNSVDCVVTDPPYALTSGNGKGFMGKEWDGAIPGVDIWKEALRVSKPGAHLLAFGGTRTHHRLVCAIEDAGWEVRDCVYWAHAQGFPKSLDISKAIDKAVGVKRDVVGKRKHPTLKDTSKIEEQANASHGSNMWAREWDLTAPATGQAKLFSGYGSALKPAIEPIILCRKPIEKGLTIAANCLKWGTGGLAIDRCRVPPTGERLGGGDEKGVSHLSGAGDGWNRPWRSDKNAVANHNAKIKDNVEKATQMGRFPSNLILDSSEEVASCFPETKSVKGNPRIAKIKNTTRLNNSKETQINCEYNDSGSAARFFQHCDYTEAERRLIYQAKPSKAERNNGCENLPEVECQTGCGGAMPFDDQGKERDRFKKKASNTHPTVKSLSLIMYLIKLVTTPTRGIVLDMFAGSGTTGVACEQLKIPFILIEKEAEYCDIIKARVEAANKPAQKKKIEKVKEKGQKQKGFFDLKKEGFV